jgi:archaellum component FlaC
MCSYEKKIKEYYADCTSLHEAEIAECKAKIAELEVRADELDSKITDCENYLEYCEAEHPGQEKYISRYDKEIAEHEDPLELVETAMIYKVNDLIGDKYETISNGKIDYIKEAISSLGVDYEQTIEKVAYLAWSIRDTATKMKLCV